MYKRLNSWVIDFVTELNMHSIGESEMVTATERGWQVFYRWMLKGGGKAFGF